MSKRSEHWKAVFRETWRGVFAPITGAIRGIREEYARVEADMNARYKAEAEARAKEKTTTQAEGETLQRTGEARR